MEPMRTRSNLLSTPKQAISVLRQYDRRRVATRSQTKTKTKTKTKQNPCYQSDKGGPGNPVGTSTRTGWSCPRSCRHSDMGRRHTHWYLIKHTTKTWSFMALNIRWT